MANNLSVVDLKTLEAATYVKDAAGNVHRLVQLTAIPVADVQQMVRCVNSQEAADFERQCYAVEETSGLPCFRIAIIDTDNPQI